MRLPTTVFKTLVITGLLESHSAGQSYVLLSISRLVQSGRTKSVVSLWLRSSFGHLKFYIWCAMPSLSDSGIVILDNGAGTIKAGLLRLGMKEYSKPLVAPNALAKPANNAISPSPSLPGKSRRPAGYLVASEIAKAPDVSAMVFRRPHERGIITTFDVQRDVWASIFSADRGIGVSWSDSHPSLVLTEALGVPLRVRRATDQLVFDVFSFGACAVVSPQRFAATAAVTSSLAASSVSPGVGKWQSRTCIVIDVGFSATTVVPIVEGREMVRAARRLSLGGKALTNLLKQTVSFRSWNMSDETAVINAVKERCCFVASEYYTELVRLRQSPALRYVLPDPTRFTDPLGHVRHPDEEDDPSEQILALRNERIAIPEALFYPSDIGLNQAGVAELVTQAVNDCDPALHPDLYANVLLTGGCCRFRGFRHRFINELRPLVCTDIDVNVYMDEDPEMTVFRGAVSAVQHDTIPLAYVTRDKYHDLGTDAILRELYGDEDT